jgi:hypothetical protein
MFRQTHALFGFPVRNRAKGAASLCHTALADQCSGRRIGRVDRERVLEQINRCACAIPGVFVKSANRTQIQIVSVEALRWLSIGPFYLGTAQARLYYTRDTAGNVVLQFENIVE